METVIAAATHMFSIQTVFMDRKGIPIAADRKGLFLKSVIGMEGI